MTYQDSIILFKILHFVRNFNCPGKTAEMDLAADFWTQPWYPVRIDFKGFNTFFDEIRNYEFDA